MKILFTLILFQTISLSLYSKDKFLDGYYISSANDTIQTKIYFDNTGVMFQKIEILDKDGNRTKLNAEDIKGFSIMGIWHYTSININREFTTYAFAKKLEGGKLNLYECNSEHWIQSGNSNYENVNIFNFKKKIALYFSDDSLITKLIEEKLVNRHSIQAIVHIYNLRKHNSNYSLNQICMLDRKKRKMYQAKLFTEKNDSIECKVSLKKFHFLINDSIYILPPKGLSSVNILDTYRFKVFRNKKGKISYKQQLIFGAINLYMSKEASSYPVGNSGISQPEGVYKGGGSRYIAETYIIEKGNAPEEILNDRNYKEILTKLIEEYPDLVKILVSHAITYDNFKVIIEKYNERKQAK